MTNDALLQVKNLNTVFDTEAGPIRAVEDVSFQIYPGKTLGIVGESGCGKSVTSLSIMRLLPKPSGHIESGEVFLNDLELTNLPTDEMRRIRGNRISMIFQEPMTALNPVHRVGKQLRESYRLHQGNLSKGQIEQASIQILQKVGIPAPDQRMKDYPHQLSGGMRQRVMIAMALACNPEILIADEPTTALDVTIQAQILDLMKALQSDTGMAIILITHDLGVIAETCDDVVVMYAGNIMESAPIFELFANPRHPYTMGLLDSIPKLDSPRKQKLKTIEGMVPDLMNLPPGCRFQNRCPYAVDKCKSEKPIKETISENHTVRCFRWQEIGVND